MFERFFFEILSRGELSLSIILLGGLALYFYIKNVDKAVKNISEKINRIQKDIHDKNEKQNNAISAIENYIAESGVKSDSFDNRLSRLEQKIDRLEEAIFLSHAQHNGHKIPSIGNGHKHLLAKITSAVSRSISDSYDISFKELFKLWLTKDLSKDSISNVFKQVIHNVEEIQRHAVENLPEKIQKYNIREVVYNIIHKALSETISDYEDLANKILTLLSLSTDNEDKQKALEIAISIISTAQTGEIDVYIEFFSNLFTESIKEELSTGKDFISIFYNKLSSQDGINYLIRKLKSVISDQIIRLDKIIKQVQEGTRLSKVKLSSRRRRSKSSTI